jgi:competence protein ComGC
MERLFNIVLAAIAVLLINSLPALAKCGEHFGVNMGSFTAIVKQVDPQLAETLAILGESSP